MRYFQRYIKPLIPRNLQIALRRIRGKRYISHYSKTWPIDEHAAQKPQGWQSWPDNKDFALVFTHDVEGDLGCSQCVKLMELEQQLGFRSAFNFVAEGYPIPDEILDTLAGNGFEIGVHGLRHNARMYYSRRNFDKYVKKINGYMKRWKASGFRSPSMYHNLQWMHAINLEYDASTFDTDPFEPQPDGMRTIFPFWVHHRDCTSGYVELPYTLSQDHLLFVILEEKSIDIWKRKLDWIAEHGGMALLNTHPDYMGWDADNLGRERYPSVYYRQFLEYVRDKYKGRYWHALPRDVAAFWKTQLQNGRSDSTQTINMKGLRVCMPTYSFYENDNRVRRYAEALVKAGNSVDIFSLRRKGQGSFEVIDGVQVHRIQQRVKNERSALSYFLKLVVFLLKSARIVTWHHLKKRYDLVHVHNIPDFEVFAAVVPKLMGSKIILDIHDIVPELFCSKFKGSLSAVWFKIMCWKEKISAAFADHIIVSNDIWLNRITERSAGRDKCSVLLNYPDPAIFSRRLPSSNDGREFVLYPGTLNRHQGLDIALEAFSRIKDQVPKVDFHIYGEGAALDALIELSKKLKIQDRVQFKGIVPLNQISDIMAGAKCGIVPKRAEVFGNEAFSTKILEFMTLGVPLVVANTAIDRYYFDSSLVLFFNPGNVEHLAEKLLLLLTDEKLREKLVKNSLEFVKDYSWAKKQQTYFSIVNSLMEGR